jgi:hypothetical protein
MALCESRECDVELALQTPRNALPVTSSCSPIGNWCARESGIMEKIFKEEQFDLALDVTSARLFEEVARVRGVM